MCPWCKLKITLYRSHGFLIATCPYFHCGWTIATVTGHNGPSEEALRQFAKQIPEWRAPEKGEKGGKGD